MKDLQKINLLQLYLFWKNLSISILLLIALLIVSTWTHSIYSIFTAIICAFVIYARIYANKTSHHPTYMLVGYALMMSIIIYTFVIMGISLLQAWGVIEISEHLSIFKGTRTVSILILSPVCFFTLLVVYLRRKKLHRWLDNHFGVNTDVFLKGKLGTLLTRESRNQVMNLMKLFGVLTVINWGYYLFFFYQDSLSKRDIYVFFWVNLAGLLFYLIYLLVHNYNLDLDLKQNGSLITPEEAGDLEPKNYFRFFVICGERLFVSYECDDPDFTAHKVLDTPFFLSRPGRMPSEDEVLDLAERSTEVRGGTLRYFFGFPAAGLRNHMVLRYFYFLDGEPEDYPQLSEERGEWKTMDELMTINRRRPHALSSYLLADAGRLVTIMRTEKTYDERGQRRYKLKSYVPTFRLADLRNSNVDFQSNKWIDIAALNSDKPFFRLRRFFRSLSRGAQNAKSWVMV